MHSATCAFIWQFNANKRARFDRVSSTVSTNESTVRLSSPPRAFSLSHTLTHSPPQRRQRVVWARKSWGGFTTWSTDPSPLRYRVHRHTQTRIYIVRIPLAIVYALHIAFFLFLSLLPSKIMQHAIAVRLHTSRSTITRFAHTYRSPGIDCAALRNYLSSGLIRIRTRFFFGRIIMFIQFMLNIRVYTCTVQITDFAA